MFHFPIGVIVESFRKETHDAIRAAAKMGAKGLQMYCTTGEHAPESFTKEARRELLAFVKDQGLCFSAVCGDLGHGFGDADKNPALIEKSKRIMELAKELETDIVTTHIAVSRVAPYAFYVHAKDFIKRTFYEGPIPAGCFQTRGCNYLRGVAVGTGDIPVKQCLAILKRAGYNGYVSIEYEGREDCIFGIKTAFENLSKFLEELA